MKYIIYMLAIIMPTFILAHESYDPKPQPVPPTYSCWNGQVVSHPGKCDNRGVKVTNNNQNNSNSNSTSNAVSSSGSQASASTGPITIDNNIDTRSRAVASSAFAAPLAGYGLPNCFGDTNPSGQLSASFAGILAGGAVSASKAHNVCAVYALMGREAAIQYLMRTDNKLPRQVIIQHTTRVSCPVSHPIYVEGKGCKK